MEDVVWFDVPVQDPTAAAVLHSLSNWRNSPCTTSSDTEAPCRKEIKEVLGLLRALHHQQEVVRELTPIQELSNTMEPSGHFVQQLCLPGYVGCVRLQEDHNGVSGADAVPGVWKPSASPGCSEPSTELTPALPPGILAASTLPGLGLPRPSCAGFCRWPRSLTSWP